MRKKRKKKQRKERARRGYTVADLDEVWVRRKRGESLKAIGRAGMGEGVSSEAMSTCQSSGLM